MRNQGPGRQTCVGFAVSAALEWCAGDGKVLSVENVIWAAHRAGGDPAAEMTSVQYACNGLDAHAATVEPSWPYGDPPFPSDRPAAAVDPVNHRANAPWERIDPPRLDDIESSLQAGRPVVVTLRFVPRAWSDLTGVVDAPHGATIAGGHAVAAVGVNEGEQLIVKNSWGPEWGDEGYGYITRQYLEAYGVVAHAFGAAA